MKKAIIFGCVGLSVLMFGCFDMAMKDAPFQSCGEGFKMVYQCPKGISCKVLSDDTVCREMCPSNYRFVDKCDEGIQCKILSDGGICDEKCSSGYVLTEGNVCPTPDEEGSCETLASGRVCRRGGTPCTGDACQNAGPNCNSGYVTVASGERDKCDDDKNVEDYTDEEMDQFLAGERFPCVQGNWGDGSRYCRLTIEEQTNPCDPGKEEDGCSIFPVLEGQVCTAEQLIPPENSMIIHIIDVGNGDAIWIETPTGQNVLIDGGDGGYMGVVSAGPIVNDYLEFHGFPKGSVFDAVFLSHPHADHFGGFSTIFADGAYRLKNYIDPMTPSTAESLGTKAYSNWLKQMKNRITNTNNIYMPAGQWALGEDMPVEFFGPSVQAQYLFSRSDVTRNDPNSTSIFFKLTYAGRSMVFGGDGEADEERDLMSQVDRLSETDPNKDILTTNFLKVCHHGSNTSSSPAWLERIWSVVDRNERGAFISSGRRKYSGTRTTRPEIVERIADYMADGKKLFLSTNAGDDNKESDKSAVRDDNIIIVIEESGDFYACYEGVN